MVIFEDYGIEIILRENRYFIKYDAGELLIKYEEIEITKEEADRAQQGEKNAYEVIIWYQNKRMGLI